MSLANRAGGVNQRRMLSAAIVAVFGLRAWLATLFPMTADEGMGWLWSRNLAWSYADHPPMLAWLNACFVAILGDPLLGLRAGAALMMAASVAIVVSLSKELARAVSNGAAETARTGGTGGADAPETSITALSDGLTFLLVPYVLVVAIVPIPENPFLLCYLATVLALVKYGRTEQTRYVWFAGVAGGLALLSKYTAVLIPPVVLMSAMLHPAWRRLLRRPALYGASVLAAAITAPAVIGELQTGGTSYAFHAGRVGVEPWFVWTLAFIGDQLLYAGPAVIVAMVGYLATRRKGAPPLDAAEALVFSAAAIPFLTFLMLSIRTHVWPHWPAAAYGPMVVLASLWCRRARWRYARRAFVAGAVGMALLLIGVLLFVSPAVVSQQAVFARNHDLAARAAAVEKLDPRTRFVTDSNAPAAQLTYYARVDVTMATGLLSPAEHGFSWRQFDRWNTRPIERGDSAVLFVRPDSDVYRKALSLFDSLEPLPDWKLTVIEGYLDGHRFYLARGFKLPSGKL